MKRPYLPLGEKVKHLFVLTACFLMVARPAIRGDIQGCAVSALSFAAAIWFFRWRRR